MTSTSAALAAGPGLPVSTDDRADLPSLPAAMKAEDPTRTPQSQRGKFVYDREFLLQLQGRGAPNATGAALPSAEDLAWIPPRRSPDVICRLGKPVALTLDDPIPPPSLLIGEQQERRFRHLLDDLADDSVRETAEAVAREIADAATMTAALRIIFELATAGNAGALAYASLCREVRERISDTVVDAELRDAEGRPVRGPPLFTKYLLNVCVERQNISVTAPPEAADRYICFLCELFKEPRMITARTMHTCVQLLLRDADTPREEDISRLCALLEDIGHLLDSSKGEAHMDIYFARLRTLSDSSHELSGPLRHRITVCSAAPGEWMEMRRPWAH